MSRDAPVAHLVPGDHGRALRRSANRTAQRAGDPDLTLGVHLRLAQPPPSVEDEASDDHPSQENGSPDPDRLADEPCDDIQSPTGAVIGFGAA